MSRQRQLSDLLRRERERAGMSVRELARRSGISASTINRIEINKILSPGPARLQQLARALEIDVEDLYAAAGYLIGQHLPALRPYLRAKYDLSDDVAGHIDDLVRTLLAGERYQDRLEEPNDTPEEDAP